MVSMCRASSGSWADTNEHLCLKPIDSADIPEKFIGLEGSVYNFWQWARKLWKSGLISLMRKIVGYLLRLMILAG